MSAPSIFPHHVLQQVAARMAALTAIPTQGGTTGGHSCRKRILLAVMVAMVSTEVFDLASLDLLDGSNTLRILMEIEASLSA
jgi:hypothetical protein